MTALEQANHNITVLIGWIIEKENDYYSMGYCCNYDNKYCDEGLCVRCKHEFLENYEQELLKKYIITDEYVNTNELKWIELRR